MTYPNSPEPTTLSDRAIRLFTDPGRRVTFFIVLTYVTAALGLGVAFIGGIDSPTTNLATVGILLLFVSFASLFYVSVTVLNLEGGLWRR